MEHRTVEMRQTAGCGTPNDDTARFLRELRQLRDYAGLGQTELAARAHYPHDCIRAAEAGPALPDLPVLSAYVRGCGGTVDEWEERWRALTNTPVLSLLPTRSAGCSTAATAGARVGSGSPGADAPDPAVILAALTRVAEKAATSTSPARPSRSTLPRVTQSSFAKPTMTQSSIAQSAAVASAAVASAAAASAKRDIAAAPTLAAKHAVIGLVFGMTSRATIAALAAIAICVLVAVLAIFA